MVMEIWCEIYFFIIKHQVFLLVVFTFALAVFTGALFYVAYRSLKKQGVYYEATSRPFVNVVEDSIELIKSSPTTDLQCVLKNFGNSPAKDVQVQSDFFSCENLKYEKIFEQGEVIYSIYPNMTLQTNYIGLNIIKNDKNVAYLHFAITYKDMANNKHNTLSIFTFKFDRIGFTGDYQLVNSIFD